jgi:NitT/TauT family transport system substrate-binding protein
VKISLHRRLVPLALAAVLALAAPAYADTLSVGIAGSSLLAYLPFTLAQRLGYFESSGLTITAKEFQGGSKSLEALVGGNVDAVIGAYENTIFMQAKGTDLTAVFLSQQRFGFVFGLKPALVSKYHSPKDLRGLKIGVSTPGSAIANAVELLLAKDGLKLSDVVIVGVGNGPGAIAAMEGGSIDAIMHSDPLITRLVHDHAIEPVVDSREEAGQIYLYGGPVASAGAYVKSDFAKKHRATVQRFVDGLVRALAWLHHATPDQIVAAVPPEFYGSDKDVYRDSLVANLRTFTLDGRVTMTNAESLLKVMARSGLIAGAGAIDLKRTFDDSFADAANRKLTGRP